MGGGDGSDIWGWADSQTGNEYALMGLTNGTAFVDVTDPENPVYLGRLETKNGFAAEQIGTIAGASGGAKWLVLSQLDRVIIDRIVPDLVGPVHLLGSSIGAWRFTCEPWRQRDTPARDLSSRVHSP